MKYSEVFDVYTDYLIACFGKATATGLSALLDGSISHDKISRFLNQKKLSNKDYWKFIKPLIRKVETAEGILKIDDFIEEKPHTDENLIVCYHWCHVKKRHIKGMNIIHFNYSGRQPVADVPFRLPVAWEIVEKPEQYYDTKAKKVKRRSVVGKNELVRNRLEILTKRNKLAYLYLVWDSWFSSKENLIFVEQVLKKKFVVALKSNRLATLSQTDKAKGNWQRINSFDLQPDVVYPLYLKGVPFKMHMVKRIFTNKGGSTGELYIITNDLSLSADQIIEIYHERWSIEDSHKSLKNNVCLQESPTQKVESQSNHIFCCMAALVKLEMLKFKEQANHFALKAKLYLKALKAAYEELQVLKAFEEEDKQENLLPSRERVQVLLA